MRARTRAPRPARAPAAAGAPRSSEEHRLRERRRTGNDPRRVTVEPLRDQGAVDAAEVGGRNEVALTVEATLQAGVLADHSAAYARADEEADAGGAVVGASRS